VMRVADLCIEGDMVLISGQVRLIGIEYSVVVLIMWAYSDSIFNEGPDRLG
jgi:hypothetical protein